MGELIWELNIVGKPLELQVLWSKPFLLLHSSTFFMVRNFPCYKVGCHIIGDEPLGLGIFYLDVLILKFGEANSCWIELANFLSLDATTIAAILKLNNRDLQSKLADSKCLWKEEIQKASHPYIIKY